ncbi:hypothetical protein R3P38DRAFT_1034049 [Favolaschia claudopus]|uniref:Uncharacterized protein n=1 Tax=Favolaschia claudopus TaxID=2862362 RepID=A0AAW0BI79_9AGAR
MAGAITATASPLHPTLVYCVRYSFLLWLSYRSAANLSFRSFSVTPPPSIFFVSSLGSRQNSVSVSSPIAYVLPPTHLIFSSRFPFFFAMCTIDASKRYDYTLPQFPTTSSPRIQLPPVFLVSNTIQFGFWLFLAWAASSRHPPLPYISTLHTIHGRIHTHGQPRARADIYLFNPIRTYNNNIEFLVLVFLRRSGHLSFPFVVTVLRLDPIYNTAAQLIQ